MTVIRATVRLEHTSGLAEDACINVWHLEQSVGDYDEESADKVAAALALFYVTIGHNYSPVISRTTNASQIQQATVNRGSAGPEDDVVSELLFTDFFTMPIQTPSTQPLPSEVAVCLSYRGDIAGLSETSSGGTIRPISRRRGRMFLGPFNTGILLGGSNPYVNGTQTELILDAYQECAESLSRLADGAPFLHHVVYSPTTALVHQIEHAWIDEQFDTVRSRGARAVGRITRDIAT